MIVLTIAGVFCGVMGRLFVTQSRLFFAIWGIAITVVPFILAIITLLIVAGKVENKRGLRIWAMLLMLTPLMGGLCMPMFFYLQRQGVTQPPTLASASPNDYPNIATPLLISKYLPAKVNEPWVWNELESRIDNRKLSPEEANDALQVLIDHMKSTKPEGWDQPLSWQDQFVRAGQQSNLISDEKMIELLDAFFKKPDIDIDRIRENSKELPFTINLGSVWSDSSLRYSLLWNVKSISIDDQVIQTKMRYRNEHDYNATYEKSLPTGDHEIKVVLEAAYIDEAKLVGLNKSKLRTSSWPKALKSWEQTVAVPFRVYSKDEEIVKLSKDLANDPRAGITCKLIAQNENEKKKIVLQLEIGEVPISCSFAIKVLVGEDEEIPLGFKYQAKRADGNTVSGSSRLSARVDQLDPEIGFADVVLLPAPSYVEEYEDVEEIWGRSIIIRNVPIERYDLEKN